ncbi:MAG TPA: peptide ABC transporter substrate-binding protein [Bacillota bacterium]|nr:peptide ABC transporter substrate-binding protein [Bacillota bacterium]
MLNSINETDWKYLRSMKKTWLDRVCNRILDNIQMECNVEQRQPDVHEQYLRIYRLVEKQDKMIADCFDDWSRSNVIFNILFLIENQVLTHEEVEQFSDETKKQLEFHLKYGR